MGKSWVCPGSWKVSLSLLEITFHCSLSVFYRNHFFPLQGGEFEGTLSADLKETARLESRLMHMTSEVALLREEISQGGVDEM